MKLSVSLLSVVAGVALLSFAGGVYAADAKMDAKTDDMAERVRLSKDLHDIRNIRERINYTVSGIAEVMPPEDRADFEEYVRGHVNFDALEKKSIQYAAEVYTVPELKAMIAYFGSADGQSAEAKSEEFGKMISKDISKEIDAAILAAKYDGVSPKSLPQSLSPAGTSDAGTTGGKGLSGRVSPDLLDAPKK